MILVTGANGFIGSRLCDTLLEKDYSLHRAVRRTDSTCPLPSDIDSRDRFFEVGNIDDNTSWHKALQGVEQVIHLAARVHVMNDDAVSPLTEFRRINVEGTVNLARQAVAAGVKRFIYLSSVKVNGENTLPANPFYADDSPAPADPYAVSKMEAEQELQQLALKTGLEVVIIRPPLVYGAGVKANFQKMISWLKRGVPLPLSNITRNRRSLVALDNLIDLVITCIGHPAAANQVFLVSDGEDLSTTALLRRLSMVMGKPARLFPVPIRLLEFGSVLLGKRAVMQRLSGSLQVDITRTQEVLNWNPPISVDEGLRKAVRG